MTIDNFKTLTANTLEFRDLIITFDKTGVCKFCKKTVTKSMRFIQRSKRGSKNTADEAKEFIMLEAAKWRRKPIYHDECLEKESES